MMKKFTFLMLMMLVGQMGFAQNFEWVRTWGAEVRYDTVFFTPINDAVSTQSIDIDSEGCVYSVGNFEGNVDFDPTMDTTYLSSAGDVDIFISKVDSLGNLVWVFTLGDTLYDYVNKIVYDGQSHLYISGNFQGSIDFDPGASNAILTSLGGYDGFLMKMDTAGNLIWVNQYGGSANDNISDHIYSDEIYAVGSFEGTVDFNPSGSSQILNSVDGDDGFLMKVSDNGNLNWTKQFGGSGLDYLACLSKYQGELVVGGSFVDTIDVDPSNQTTNLYSSAGRDLFIANLDTSGNFNWIHQISGPGVNVLSTVEYSSVGEIYVGGYYQSSINMNFLGSAVNFNTLTGDRNAFIQKLSPQGSSIWQIELRGDQGDSYCNGIQVADDHIYIAGGFNDSLDYDPSTNVALIEAQSNFDGYILKLDTSGSFLRFRAISGSGYGMITDLKLKNNAEDLYTSGTVSGNTDFDPSANTYVLSSSTSGNCSEVCFYNRNGYIQKFSTDQIVSNDYVQMGSFSFQVVPNPVQTQLSLEFAKVSDYSILATDLTGRVIYQTQLNNSNRLELNTANWPAGVYAIQVRTEDGQLMTKKVVKQ